MARFIELSSPDGRLTYWVNMDLVRFMQDGGTDKPYTALKFDNEQMVSVAGPAATIAAKCRD